MFSIEFVAGILAIITTLVGGTIKIVQVALKIRDSVDNFKRMVSMQDKTILEEINKQEQKILSLENEINHLKIELSLLHEASNFQDRNS